MRQFGGQGILAWTLWNLSICGSNFSTSIYACHAGGFLLKQMAVWRMVVPFNQEMVQGERVALPSPSIMVPIAFDPSHPQQLLSMKTQQRSSLVTVSLARTHYSVHKWSSLKIRVLLSSSPQVCQKELKKGLIPHCGTQRPTLKLTACF